MNFELPKIVSQKTGTVLERTLHNVDSSYSRYTVRKLTPGTDTFLSKKGVACIRKDSDSKTLLMYNKDGKLVLAALPQEMKSYIDMMRKFPNINLDSFVK